MLRYANCLLSRLCWVPLVLLVLCGTGQCQSTTRVDISKCFSEVLVTDTAVQISPESRRGDEESRGIVSGRGWFRG